MDITWTGDPDHPGRKVITITVDPADDQHDHINGLLLRGRLDAFLTLLGGNHEGLDVDNFRDLLTRAAYVTSLAGTRLDGLLLAARERYGLGWGSIANALDEPRQTVKGRIERLQRQ